MIALDYANQRYYASGLGRFTSPDPYIAAEGGEIDAGTPQSWNRYAYVTGDPVNLIDPPGLFGCQPEVCGDSGSDNQGGGSDAAGGGMQVVNYYGKAPAYYGNAPEVDKGGGGGIGGVLSTAASCASQQLGLTDALAAAGFILGQPIVPASGKFMGATLGTSPLSSVLSQLLPWTLSSDYWAPTYKIFRMTMSTSNNVGRIVGRWIPFVGAGILVWDAVSIAGCTIQGSGTPKAAVSAAAVNQLTADPVRKNPPPGKVGITDPMKRIIIGAGVQQ